MCRVPRQFRPSTFQSPSPKSSSSRQAGVFQQDNVPKYHTCDLFSSNTSRRSVRVGSWKDMACLDYMGRVLWKPAFRIRTGISMGSVLHWMDGGKKVLLHLVAVVAGIPCVAVLSTPASKGAVPCHHPKPQVMHETYIAPWYQSQAQASLGRCCLR